MGYVLSPNDPYVGIDLDKCRDPHSGRIEPWAKAIVKRLDSYTEISPSGTGLRIFIRGTLPAHGRRKGHIEIYSQARFLTITGQHYLAAPDTIQDRADELLTWHLEIFGPPPAPRQNGQVARAPVQLADADLLLKARSAENGGRFWALWNGDYSAYGSQSEADLALVNHLAFWTGPDSARLDQLFRSSGLMREKWDRQDYRDRTIDKALEGRTEYYSGGSNGRLTISAPARQVDPETGEVVYESPWQTLQELADSTPDVQVQAVQGLLWAGRTHWAYSAPGVGKTIFLTAALMHVAAGVDFCGRPVKQGPVVLIEEDSPLAVLGEYVSMLADIYNFDLSTLPFWVNRRQGFRINDANAVLEVLTAAPQFPSVIVLDACERILPSEKFSSKELDPLSTLLQQTAAQGVTNVVIDHTRKSPTTAGNQQDPLDLLYGGRSKSAISDVMLYFSGAIKSSARIAFTKFRGQTPSPLDISFDTAQGFTIRGKPREFTESERQVMYVLNNEHGEWLTKSQIEERVKMSERTVSRMLSRLWAEGFIERDEAERPARYRLSAAAPGMFQVSS